MQSCTIETTKKASIWFGRTIILLLLLISIINCWTQWEQINYILTILSGIVINIGTVFQIIFILVDSKVIFPDYPIYLFVGMAILEVCQVYSYIIEEQEILSVVIGNTISVVVNITFNIVLRLKKDTTST